MSDDRIYFTLNVLVNFRISDNGWKCFVALNLIYSMGTSIYARAPFPHKLLGNRKAL